MLRASAFLLLGLVAIVTCLGCGSVGSSHGQEGVEGGLPPASSDLSPQQVCAQLLTCIERADTPVVSSYGAFVAQYGPTGTCWTSYSADQCAAACVGELQNQFAAGAGLACNFCQSDASCMNPDELPVCDPATHSCVGCLTDQDCASTPGFIGANRLFCAADQHTCGQCRTDADCPPARNLSCVPIGGINSCECESAECPS